MSNPNNSPSAHCRKFRLASQASSFVFLLSFPEKILPIVKNECLLLCTLLIGKSLALETLPIFLDTIFPFWAAILVSVTFVIAFAEVIPQAVCSRYGLSFGAKFVSFVQFLLFIFFPVAYPISKLLDWLLGKSRSALLRRTELKTLVDLHSVKAGKGGELTDDETTIITGALNMTERTAKDAMTPISKTFSLDINSKLDMYTMGAIVSQGHSRVPVYTGNATNIIGLILLKLLYCHLCGHSIQNVPISSRYLFVKNLIFCHPEDETPIKDLIIRKIPRVHENWPLYDVLKLFQKGHSHMAVVVKCKKDPKQTSKDPKVRPDFTSIRIQSNPELTQADGKDCGDFSGSKPPFAAKELRNDSPIHSGYGEIQSLAWIRREKGEANVLKHEMESHENKLSHDEVIGIITMEDVMEELLQEEILDETDQHIDIHKIRINILPPRRLSSSSPGTASLSQFYRRTPEPEDSPISYYHSPILHSPIPPFVPSPFVKPVLYASPGKAVSNSPIRSAGTVRSSPSSRQVSRKSYERLRQGSNA
ncbi:DUF21 domain-containing protein At2g14520-like [Olea europaea var. sylvestris]|uniref:DUF21 domain-containing protein At2g14520-like n=1 Tax=Olea europaea var. sylvestris TaxID=158386 RepID=UPI000C1D637D|nr:DUF21 domain-containing protein At2g14520-like [Olea europaea var. sylvestris]